MAQAPPTADGHPAAAWAAATGFSTTQVDCTTAVMLKILDGKCKMTPAEQEALAAVYDVIRTGRGSLFGAAEHALISRARRGAETPAASALTAESIHHLRLRAEAEIPKPVMKTYKQFLRAGLGKRQTGG